MLIKSADDKSRRLALLQDLQKSPLLDAGQKEWLRDVVLNQRAGTKGEQVAVNQSKTSCLLKDFEKNDFNRKDGNQSLVRATWSRLQPGVFK